MKHLSLILILVSSVFFIAEGIWGLGLYHHWPFIMVIALVLPVLGLAIINDFSHKSIYAFLSHSGLFLVLCGGLLGASGSTDALMKVQIGGRDEHLAIDADGNTIHLPFSVVLEEFNIDYYEDGISPKQYTSILSIDGRTLQTSVNHPCRYKGYGLRAIFDFENCP